MEISILFWKIVPLLKK